MDLMKGKKGVIFGVSNTHGIAYGIAKQLHDAGAEIAFTYAGEAMEKRVKLVVANEISEEVDTVLNEHKRSSMDALVTSLETLLS